jgi:hypothetical protein
VAQKSSSPRRNAFEQVHGLVGQPNGPLLYMMDEPEPGFRSYDKEAGSQPVTPVADEVAGYDMLYSSGTTGRPKGIKREFEGNRIDVPNQFLKISLRRHVRDERRQHLSVAGAALSCGSPALQHDGDHPRRHLRYHGGISMPRSF